MADEDGLVDQALLRWDGRRGFGPVADSLRVAESEQLYQHRLLGVLDFQYRQADAPRSLCFTRLPAQIDDQQRGIVFCRAPGEVGGRVGTVVHALVGRRIDAGVALGLGHDWRGARGGAAGYGWLLPEPPGSMLADPEPPVSLGRLEASQLREIAWIRLADRKYEARRAAYEQELVRLVEGLLRAGNERLAIFGCGSDPVVLLAAAREILRNYVSADWSFSTGELTEKPLFRVTFMLPGTQVVTADYADLERDPSESSHLEDARRLVAAYREAESAGAWNEALTEAGVQDTATLLAWAATGTSSSRRAREELDRLRAESQSIQQDLQAALERSEGERVVLSEERVVLSEERNGLAATVGERDTQLADLLARFRRETTELRSQLAERDREAHELLAQRDTALSQREADRERQLAELARFEALVAERETEVVGLRNGSAGRETAQAELDAERRRQLAELERFKAVVGKREEEIAKLRDEIGRRETVLADLGADRQRQSAHLAQLEALVPERDREIASLRNELSEYQDQMRQLSQENLRLTSGLEAHRAMLTDQEHGLEDLVRARDRVAELERSLAGLREDVDRRVRVADQRVVALELWIRETTSRHEAEVASVEAEREQLRSRLELLAADRGAPPSDETQADAGRRTAESDRLRLQLAATAQELKDAQDDVARLRDERGSFERLATESERRQLALAIAAQAGETAELPGEKSLPFGWLRPWHGRTELLAGRHPVFRWATEPRLAGRIRLVVVLAAFVALLVVAFLGDVLL